MVAGRKPGEPPVGQGGRVAAWSPADLGCLSTKVHREDLPTGGFVPPDRGIRSSIHTGLHWISTPFRDLGVDSLIPRPSVLNRLPHRIDLESLIVSGTEKRLMEARAERTRERRLRRAHSADPETPARNGTGRKLGWNGADLLLLFKLTFSRWSEDKVPKLAAALAFYTSFSVAPILFIAIAVAGVLFGADAAGDGISKEISRLVGARIGEGLETVLKRACQPRTGVHATILGGVALVFGAYGVFGELQDSLNIIWKVRRKEGRGIWATIRARFLSFLLVLAIGLLLLVSLVLTAGFAALGQALLGLGGEDLLIGLLNQAFSLLVITALFGAAFKLLPNAKTRWRDVGVGALLTAVLFALGKVLIGLYLRNSTAGSVYGAAGSFVLLLLWIYYSSQIFFFGAEFTKTWADTHGRPPEPQDDAITVPEPQLLSEDPRA